MIRIDSPSVALARAVREQGERAERDTAEARRRQEQTKARMLAIAARLHPPETPPEPPAPPAPAAAPAPAPAEPARQTMSEHHHHWHFANGVSSYEMGTLVPNTTDCGCDDERTP